MKYFSKDYFLSIGSGLSQLAYATISGCKNSNLSISGEMYYHRHDGKFYAFMYKLINMIFFLQNDHCKWAYEGDLRLAKWYVKRDEQFTDHSQDKEDISIQE